MSGSVFLLWTGAWRGFSLWFEEGAMTHRGVDANDDRLVSEFVPWGTAGHEHSSAVGAVLLDPAHALAPAPLGRQPADDELRGCGCLMIPCAQRRHDVQPLGAALADLDHLPPPARALGAVRFDDLFDTLKALGQMTRLGRGA